MTAGVLFARRASLHLTAAVAVGSLALLWLWSVLSTRWAESADQAVTYANRWLLYAIVLLGLLMLLRSRFDARLLVASATAGILAVAASVLARMLASGGELFVGNRLNEPLNYINGEAGYLLIAFWPLIAVAERARSPLVAGAAAAAAVPVAALAVLTQSRGALLAFAVSAVALLILVPGRTRRGWALVAVGLGLLVAAGPLGDVTATLPPGATAPPDDELRAAAVASLLGGGLAGGLWIAACALAARSRRSDVGNARLRRASQAALIAVATIGVAVAIFPVDRRVDEVRDQYDSFTELRPVGTEARLVSGGGNRYDYWRVAWDQFRDHPLRGIGAGNYDTTYFRERRTNEDLHQPHSLQLQALGETGIVGGALVAVFAACVLLAFWRRAVGGRAGAADPGLAVAAGGGFLVWLVHTNVDWLHLIPGLTGVALCFGAALLSEPRHQSAAPASRLRTVSVAVGIAIAIGAAAYSIGRPALARKLRLDAQDRLLSDPAAAIRDARDSLALDDEPLPTYYVEAAAYARLNRYEEARAALLEATRREPHDHVSWALLGDLATRRGDQPAARAAYRRAAMLNPRGGIRARRGTG